MAPVIPAAHGKKAQQKKMMLYGGIAAAVIVAYLLYRRSAGASSSSTTPATDPNAIAANAAAAQAASDQAALGSGGGGSVSGGSDISGAYQSLSDLLTQLPGSIASGLQAAYASTPGTGTPTTSDPSSPSPVANAAPAPTPVSIVINGAAAAPGGTVSGNKTGQQTGAATSGVKPSTHVAVNSVVGNPRQGLDYTTKTISGKTAHVYTTAVPGGQTVKGVSGTKNVIFL